MQASTNKNNTALASIAQVDEKCISSVDHPAGDSTPESDTAHGWLVIAGSFVYTMASVGTAASFGVYMDEYLTKEFPDTPSSMLAWISTMQIGLTFFCGIIFGPMMECIDIRIVGIIGTLFSGAGLLIASACISPASLIATQGIITGIGFSAMFTVAMTLPSQWMVKYKPIAVGIAISGSAIGGIWQSFAMRAIIKSHGYRWALRISGLIQIALCSSATLPMKRRIEAPPRKRFVEHTLLRDPKFILLLLFGITGGAGFFIPFAFMPNYAVVVLHKDISWDANISALMNVGGFFGRLLSGILATYIGPISTLAICSLVSSLGIFVLWLPFKNTAVLIIEAIVFGMSSGSLVTVFPVAAASLYGLQRLPSILGLLFVSFFAGQLISSPVAGRLLDKYGHGADFSSLIIYTGTLFAVAVVFLVIVRLLITKDIFAKV